MPKRGLIALILTLAGLRLIVAYSPPGGDIGSVDPSAAPTDSPAASSTPTPTKTPKPSKAPTGTLKDGTYDGDAIKFKFGTAQVEIVVSGGVITEVKALKLPTAGGYTKRVTTFFQTDIPARIVADQGWKISNVGGATYTSRAYSQSLQSAINQAS
ncbi:MAG: FMN-binding protein [Chloroflexi bacterium]|jgi:uncharacterized protein with FMN-binding domain|nr:FMN-binding protein [Chloroflexota bacterium]